MTPEQAAAYVTAMAACANADMIGMKMTNKADKEAGRPATYSANDFMALSEKYGIHHNAVMSLFGQAIG